MSTLSEWTTKRPASLALYLLGHVVQYLTLATMAATGENRLRYLVALGAMLQAVGGLLELPRVLSGAKGLVLSLLFATLLGGALHGLLRGNWQPYFYETPCSVR